MAKATHKGHCQACGRLQMLPSNGYNPTVGKLAKHGYTVAQGFFSGTCVGSGELPFEVSCDLVKTFIASAQHQLEGVERFQADLRKLTEGPTAWFHVSLANGKGKGYGPIRCWRECTVTQEIVTYEDGTPRGGSYNKFHRDGDTYSYRTAGEPTPHAQEVSSGYHDSLAEVCTKANRTYADWLEHEADSLRRYIAWQTERVASWKPGTLLPVAAKDKQGFEPTVARY